METCSEPSSRTTRVLQWRDRSCAAAGPIAGCRHIRAPCWPHTAACCSLSRTEASASPRDNHTSLRLLVERASRCSLAACNLPARGAEFSLRRPPVDKKNLEGKLDKAKGKIKEVGGVSTDNRDLEAEGKADQLKGKVKEGLGNLREGIKERLDRLDEDKGEGR